MTSFEAFSVGVACGAWLMLLVNWVLSWGDMRFSERVPRIHASDATAQRARYATDEEARESGKRMMAKHRKALERLAKS